VGLRSVVRLCVRGRESDCLASVALPGRKWTYKGVRHSYVNARCETGRLQARGEFTFNDGIYLSGTFLRPCKVIK
jgi:hypothetical protein